MQNDAAIMKVQLESAQVQQAAKVWMMTTARDITTRMPRADCCLFDPGGASGLQLQSLLRSLRL